MDALFADALSHLLWIGVSPCSGKSTIAAMLAERHGLAVYNCDDAVDRHVRLGDPDRAPTMHRLSHASCDELWMRPLEQQVREEILYYDEEFPFILDDLQAMPGDQPIIAEGAVLMRHLLASIGVFPARAIWLVPSPAFQRKHYGQREWRHDVLSDCADRAEAWDNWMERDIGFATYVRDEARRSGFPCLTIDGTRPVDAILDDVSQHFGLS